MPNLTVAQIQEFIDRADRDEMIGVISSSYKYLMDDESGTALGKRTLLCLAVARNPNFVVSFADFLSMVLALHPEEEHLQLFTGMASQDGVSDDALVEIIENYQNKEFYLQLLRDDSIGPIILLKIMSLASSDEELYSRISEHPNINDDVRVRLLRATRDITNAHIKSFLQQEELSEVVFKYACIFLKYQETKGDGALYKAEEFIVDFCSDRCRKSVDLQILSLNVCINHAERMRIFLEARKGRPLEQELKSAMLERIDRVDVLWQVVNICADDILPNDELAIVNNTCMQDNVGVLTDLLSKFKSFKAKRRILDIMPQESIIADILPVNLHRGLVRLAFERSLALTIYDLIAICRRQEVFHVELSLSEECIIGLLERSIIKEGDADELLYLLSKTTEVNFLSALIKHTDTPKEVLMGIIDHKLATPAFLLDSINILCSAGKDFGLAVVHRALKESKPEDRARILHGIVDFAGGDSDYIDILKEVIVVANSMHGEMQALGRDLLVRIYSVVPRDSDLVKDILTSESLSENDIYAMVEAKLVADDIEDLRLIVNYRESLNHRIIVRILSELDTVSIPDDLIALIALKAEEVDSLIKICRVGCSESILRAVAMAANEKAEKEAVLVEVFKCKQATIDLLPEITEDNVRNLQAVYMQALHHPKIGVACGMPLFNLLNIKATNELVLAQLFKRILEESGVDIHTASLFFEHQNTPPCVMFDLMNIVHSSIADEDNVGAMIAEQHLVRAFNHKNRDNNVLLSIVRSKFARESILIAFIRSDDEEFDLEVLDSILSNPNASTAVIEALLQHYIFSLERESYLNKELLEKACSSSNLSIEAIDRLVQKLNLLDEDIKLARINEWQDALNNLIANRKDLTPEIVFKIATLSISQANLKAVIYAAFVIYRFSEDIKQSILDLPNIKLLVGPLSLVMEILQFDIEFSSREIDMLYNLWVKKEITSSPEMYAEEGRHIRDIVDNVLGRTTTSLSILFDLIAIEDPRVLARCTAHPNSSPELNQAIYERYRSTAVKILLSSDKTSSHTLLEMARTEDSSLLEHIRSHVNISAEVIAVIEIRQQEEELARLREEAIKLERSREEELARLREKSLKEAKDIRASSTLLAHIGSVALSRAEQEAVATIKASNDGEALQALQAARRRNTKF